MLADPIAALATPPGRSALAVIRLSGRGVFEVASRVIRGFVVEPPRVARLAPFVDAAGELVDRGIYLAYPAPRSYTGEDQVELMCHGGTLVPARLLAALQAAGARPALPGEFTRRAVLNGKLDLVQAEAIGDLVEARVTAQARAALHQLDGALSRRIAALRPLLLELQAALSYEIDFPDEDDGPVPRSRLAETLDTVARRLDQLLATAPGAARVREGAVVVLAGPPNSGKSSLFNALLGLDRALVTELPGTTRDAIEAPADFHGWPIRLVDTAGLGEAQDRVDALGQAMSRRYIAAADLVLECHDGSITEADFRERRVAWGIADEGRVLRVRTKADLPPPASGGEVRVSAVTGEGLDRLRALVAERLFGEAVPLADLEPALTRDRHRVALARAREAVEAARHHLAPEGDAVLAAHHVREAMLALDELIGPVDIEDVLDRLFATFCVGK
ncbi:MAG TPA: tRNA uridine-5-carboxymethylaminomethyl(34) synthesis GTPase MnmE [Gemmatimonadales bacterium]|nr:tRNA uridine-5-carboxymethylaminomethyl(34) synthesis GTPase MnmE [Gemmatimonadales bacterium]